MTVTVFVVPRTSRLSRVSYREKSGLALMSSSLPDVTIRDPVPAPNDELLAAIRRGARIASASDARRRRAERELHDGVQQHLALIGLKLALLKDLIGRDPDGAQEMCDELNQSLQAAMQELRTLAYWIYPAVLENEGLAAALRDAAERIAIPTRFELDGSSRYARDVEAAVYFCCLEGLQNAAKHAGERAQVTIAMADAEGNLVFEVSDDGAGFEPSADEIRAGLQQVTDRVEALGGELCVISAPGQGTRIRGRIALRA